MSQTFLKTHPLVESPGKRGRGFTQAELPAVSKRKRAAFTLVELLVVIGIIALLISVLLPALNKARIAANTVACASNMRQIGYALQMYANQSKGWTPPTYFNAQPTGSVYDPGADYYHGGKWDSSFYSWYMWLGDVLGQHPPHDKTIGFCLFSAGMRPEGNWFGVMPLGMWNCPSNNIQLVPFGAGVGENNISYAINGKDSDREGDPGPYGGHENRFCQLKVTAIRKPAELYSVLEGQYFRVFNEWNVSPANNSIPPVATPSVDQSRYPHNKGMNILYADGHVAWNGGPLIGNGNPITPPNPGGRNNDQHHVAYWTNGVHWYAN